MSVYLRGTSWCYRFECRGVRYRVTVGPAALVTKRQAQDAERLARAKALAGTLPPQRHRSPRFRAFAAEVRTHAATRRTGRSLTRALIMLEHFVAFFGHDRLDDITLAQIEQYKRARARDGLAPGTINLELAYLRHVFRLAVLWGKAQRNPVVGVARYRDIPRHVRWLTVAEEGALLAACAPPLRLLVLVALHTGLRKSELLSLRWEQVDLARQTLTVHAATAKTGKTRTVPLSQATATALQPLAQATGPVFRHRLGRPYRQPDRAFKAAVQRSGIAPCRFHDLRHTFASRLVQAGTALQVVQTLLGHANLSQTLVYSHLAPGQTRQAITLFDAHPATNPATHELQKNLEHFYGLSFQEVHDLH